MRQWLGLLAASFVLVLGGSYAWVHRNHVANAVALTGVTSIGAGESVIFIETVDLTTAADFLKAGACCLGIGGQLVEPKAVAARDFDRIRSLARQYVAVVQQARKP